MYVPHPHLYGYLFFVYCLCGLRHLACSNSDNFGNWNYFRHVAGLLGLDRPLTKALRTQDSKHRGKWTNIRTPEWHLGTWSQCSSGVIRCCMSLVIGMVNLFVSVADPSRRAVWGVGLRPLPCWDWVSNGYLYLCVLSGIGRCDGPNPRSEESYRVCLCHRVDSSIINMQSFKEADCDTDY